MDGKRTLRIAVVRDLKSGMTACVGQHLRGDAEMRHDVAAGTWLYVAVHQYRDVEVEVARIRESRLQDELQGHACLEAAVPFVEVRRAVSSDVRVGARDVAVATEVLAAISEECRSPPAILLPARSEAPGVRGSAWMAELHAVVGRLVSSAGNEELGGAAESGAEMSRPPEIETIQTAWVGGARFVTTSPWLQMPAVRSHARVCARAVCVIIRGARAPVVISLCARALRQSKGTRTFSCMRPGRRRTEAGYFAPAWGRCAKPTCKCTRSARHRSAAPAPAPAVARLLGGRSADA